jgi:hypothetical protein
MRFIVAASGSKGAARVLRLAEAESAKRAHGMEPAQAR